MKHILLALLLALSLPSMAQTAWNAPSAGNPFIPGYFADPTIRKFGDTYYIYATTDGTGNGYGPAQVWMSKDFRNWRNVVMNWPTTEVVWAPDVIDAGNGKYRYYYCEPCMVHVGESDSPVGPWHNMLGRPDAVLMPDRYCDPMAITLDPMVFTDDDGSQYLFVGTWGIYDKSGCGWAKLTKEGTLPPRGSEEGAKGLVPNTQLKEFFEAPFVFKRNGKYYFTYSSGSCHDDTYRVQYAVSTVGPTGPYEYKGCILSTNADGTVHGPGHHSILIDEGQYYIVYHRHNNPHSVHGFNRQLCIDKMEFDANGNILPIVPTHDGILPASLQAKAKKTVARNLAFQANVTASSVLGSDFKAEYAVDDNNATLWRPANNQGSSWLQIDLGKVQKFNQVWLQFEYPTFFYQYKVETSTDGTNWQLYADKTENRNAGSPMIEKGQAKARYVRITITDTQKNGHFGALWNVKVFNASRKNDPEALLPPVPDMDMQAVEEGYPNLHKKDVESDTRISYPGGLILDLNADKDNAAAIAGQPQPNLIREVVKGKYGYYFDGKQSLSTSFDCPQQLCYNSAFTLAAWVLNPSVGPVECIASVCPQTGDLTALQLGNGRDKSTGLMNHAGSFESFGQPDLIASGQGQWQHWVVTYDGWHERAYLNGRLVHEQNNFLMLRPQGSITIGADQRGADGFSGYLHSLRLYDRALTGQEVQSEYEVPSSTTDRSQLDVNSLQLKAERIAPTLAHVVLTDAQGRPVRSGRLNFSEGIMTIAEKDATLTIQVCDEELSATVAGKDGVQLSASLPDAPKASYTLTELPGPLRLESHDTNLDRDPSHMLVTGEGTRPTKLFDAKGDFLLQVRVSDIMGRERRNTPAYNEGGIIILSEEEGGHAQNLIHLGVFPAYNCGNMLTTVTRQGRPQYPNQQGWDYDPYLQLQRKGDTIYARTSRDGIHWTEMPGSPVSARLLRGNAVKVGLYQTTYSANRAWVEFSDFKLWK